MQQLLHFVSGHWELFLALAVICILLIYQTFGTVGGGKSVDPQEAIRMINHEQAVVLDVREPGEVKTGKILGSISIPLAQLEKQMDKLQQHKAAPIIVVCQSGGRSSRACSILRKQGFESVYNLRGGIMAWTSTGLPLSKKGA